MGFNVVLTVRGICAFVPREPGRLAEEGSIKAMKLLVLDARQSRVITAGPRTPIDLNICAHLPLLRFTRPNKPMDFFILDGHRIELSGIDPKPLVINPSFGNGTQVEKLIGNQARVPGRFLSDLPPAGIVGTMDLTSGDVEAFDQTAPWEFLPQPIPPYAHRFAGAARVTIPITGDETELKLIARDGSTALERELRPRGGSNTVDLQLSNLCFDEEHPPRVEADYAVFYDILDNYTGMLHVPHKGVASNPPNPPSNPPSNRASSPGTVPGEATRSPACVFAIMASS